MKNAQRIFAKIDVLSCDIRLDKQTNRQAMDRDGNLLWNIDVEEEVFNEKHNKKTNAITTYKTIEELGIGEHVVELKVTSMGEGSGSFIKVNTFYTVLRSVEMKASIGDIFKLDKKIPLSKKQNLKAGIGNTQLAQ